LEKKIILWIESHGKIAKGEAGIRRYHSNVDHIVTFRIIAEEFCNSKTNLFVVLLNLENILTWFL